MEAEALRQREEAETTRRTLTNSTLSVASQLEKAMEMGLSAADAAAQKLAAQVEGLQQQMKELQSTAVREDQVRVLGACLVTHSSLGSGERGNCANLTWSAAVSAMNDEL